MKFPPLLYKKPPVVALSSTQEEEELAEIIELPTLNGSFESSSELKLVDSTEWWVLDDEFCGYFVDHQVGEGESVIL
nr:dehydration-responsive element-binding protein 3-like [Ipomoea batatas]